jgi:hypothetical protein
MVWDTVQTVNYGEFSGGIHERFSGQRAPMDVSIEVTRRCPLDCLHCYNNLPMGDQNARAQELTLAEHIRLLDELVAAWTFTRKPKSAVSSSLFSPTAR